MEKIIFFSLVIPIFGFVLYLGVSAIMKGMSAKNTNKENQNLENSEIENSSDFKKNLGDELDKLNNLLKEGVLTQEEFQKAKKKLFFPLINLHHPLSNFFHTLTKRHILLKMFLQSYHNQIQFVDHKGTNLTG